jgi:hypothetical protein
MKLVIDQNSFRLPDLALKNHLSASIINIAVVTDTALFEMLKGSDPVYAATRSCEVLREFPDQVVVTAGTGELIRQEIAGKAPISAPEDPKLTADFRALLREIKKHADGARADFPLDPAVLQPVITTARAQRIDSPLHKTSLIGAVDVLRKQVPEQLRRDARQQQLTRPLYEFIYLGSFTVFRDIMAKKGVTEETAKELFLDYSLCARLVMLYQLSIVGWFASSGAASLDEPAATNDFLDVDYVTMATYFDGLISKEKRVNALYARAKTFFEYPRQAP